MNIELTHRHQSERRPSQPLLLLNHDPCGPFTAALPCVCDTSCGPCGCTGGETTHEDCDREVVWDSQSIVKDDEAENTASCVDVGFQDCMYMRLSGVTC